MNSMTNIKQAQEKKLRKEFDEVVQYLITNKAVCDWCIAKINHAIKDERERILSIVRSQRVATSHPSEYVDGQNRSVDDIINLINKEEV